MDNEKIKTTRSTICLFITAFIWGVAFVAQRIGADYLGSFTFNGVRFMLGTISLIPVILIFERVPKDKAKSKTTFFAGLGGGLILYAAAALQQFGVAITGSAGKSGFITGLYIVLVPVLGIFLKRKTTLFTWLGAVFACIGLFFLSGAEGFLQINIGDVVLLIGAFFWAAHILLIDRFSSSINPLRFSMVQFFFCSVLSLISAFIFEEVKTSAILDAYIPILYSGILSVGIAYTLQVIGQKRVPPARAAIIFSLESLFSAAGAAVLLNEIMTFYGYIGCVFIFAGIIISQLKIKTKTSSKV